MKQIKAVLKQVSAPQKDCANVPVGLSDETIAERKQKVLAAMKARGLDQLIVYGDVEHGGNFEYLVGYFTRFEEALLVLNANGKATLVLGNENLNKAAKARIEAAAVHVSLFSLPNQPHRHDKSLRTLLQEAGIAEGQRTGLVGWKLFTSPLEDNRQSYDIPSYVVEAVKAIVGEAQLSNETGLFIGENGVRTTNNANEIAHYEYAAALASDCVLDAMDKLEPGVSELELGDALVRKGQHTSIVTIASSGPRFVKANMFPMANTVKLGDPISLTVGYRGGSSSRAGVAVHNADELPEAQRDYLERVAGPYFSAYAAWLETIHIGQTGGDLFNTVETVLPRAQYGWSLCPGHLSAEEEWMASPVYEGSTEILKSGMLFQIDIIPSVSGYPGTSAESTVVLADAELQRQIQQEYPQMWQRMQARRTYLKETLNIQLSEDVLPMCSTVAYLRPFLLNKDSVLVAE
ncbi:M24 family metallopeptidase [Holdemania filiformis]|uniref:M24 family metallopeptidase n=1 Tax=Holdemania filiformis TaxID=61171 RepID=UPI002670338B|nr:aminopeptidase P family protein [Holdemania filiformis]